jgi:type I restriction-modification system DNA methylase subunit
VIDTDFLLNISEGSTSWKKLKLYFSSECFEKFGGILFEDKKIFDKIYVRDELISKFIESLYYPNPYKFDVITPALLGNIYERYLGRKLVIKGSKVTDDFKEEYQKTKGAVYTPDYIVRAVCAKTLNPLMLKKSVAEIKKLKILDPSCGSGSFLLGIFDFLSDFFSRKIFEGKPFGKRQKKFLD